MKRYFVTGVVSALTLVVCGCPTQTPTRVGYIYPELAVDGIFVGQGVSIDEYDNGDLFVLGKGTVLDRAQVPIGIRLSPSGDVEWATLVPLPSTIDLENPGTETLNTLLRFRLPDFPADVAPDQEVVLASRIPFELVRATIRHVRLSPEGDFVIDDSQVAEGPTTVSATLATQDSGNVILGASENSMSFLLKLDKNANQVWSTNVEELLPTVIAMAEDSVGNLFVVGDADSAAASLAKFSSSGDVIWSREIGGAGTGVPSIPQSIAATPDGGAVFAGPKFGSATTVTRVDADGSLLWVNTDAIGSRLNADDYQPMDIAVDSDGNTVVVGLGTTKSQILMFQIFTDVAFIAKFDPDGDMLWLRTLPTDYYLMNAVTVLHDGTYATAGFADDINNYSSLNVILFDPETGDVIN